MKRVWDICRLLTSAKGWEAVFLTLIVCFSPTSNLYAADDETASVPSPMSTGQSMDPALGEVDQDHRVAVLLRYVRQQAPGWAPGLNEKLRAPLGWIKSFGRSFGIGGGDNADDDESGMGVPSFLRPVSNMMQAPSDASGEAFWLTPGYHHKGFLPFHDAMMTGVNFRERALGDRMQFDFRPFYGQNWVSLNGYGGAELGIGLTHGGEAQPWGRIALRYTDGASYLMDRSRGFDMNAELRFDTHLSLISGVRGDGTSDLGNYALMRWKLMEFGP